MQLIIQIQSCLRYDHVKLYTAIDLIFFLQNSSTIHHVIPEYEIVGFADVIVCAQSHMLIIRRKIVQTTAIKCFTFSLGNQ